MAEIEITEYDLNKQVMSSREALSEYALTHAISDIAAWFSFKKDKYFWLTNRELIDMLLFHLRGSDYYGASQALQAELTARGEILDMEYSQERGCYDIWIRTEDGCYLYYLYPYDSGVIEV